MIKKILIFLFSILMFNACSSTPTPASSMEFEGAPEWIDNPTVEGSISDIGSAPMNAGGDFSFQRSLALANARDNLASQLKTTVKTLTESFKASTGGKADATFDQASEKVSRQLAEAVLTGSKQIGSWRSKSGTLYLLMVLDANAIAQKLQETVKTSMGNEHAQFQKFLAKQGQDKLAKAFSEKK